MLTVRLPPGRWLLLGALVAVALNLRGAIVAVAPVLGDIQQDLRIGETAAGLLTAVPVLCFAAASPLVGGYARRLGSYPAVAVSVLVLGVAIVVRPWAGFGVMLAGTVLIGAAIAVGNVLLPVVARRDFPDRAGPVMSAVTTSLVVSAAAAAFLTVPLASLVGWRGALALWAVPAVVALGVWLLAARQAAAAAAAASAAAGTGGDNGAVDDHQPSAAVPSAWRAPAAWELGVFFGLQSLLYYAATAWLPTMLRTDGGLGATAAGTALSLLQLLGIAGALAAPLLLRGRRLRYALPVTLTILWLAFFAGLLVFPGAWPLWCVLGGVAQGAALGMGLSLIALRSSGGAAARTVSGVVQSVGYCLAAAGPVAVGAVSAATAGWTVPFLVLMVIAVGWGVLGLRTARPQLIR